MTPILLLLLLNPSASKTLPPMPELEKPSAEASRIAEPALSTPTARRLDQATTAAQRALHTDLERLIASPGWRGDEWGVLVVSLDRGDTIYSHNPDAQLAPASNLKLYTSAAALYYLGPNFRYNTFLISSGTVEDGILSGDIILYGTGDPTLSDRYYRTKTTVWDNFADSLEAQGIREIHGDIVGDASYFSGPGSGEGWQESYISASYAVLSSALSFNDNLVTLHIQPGGEAGWRPEVQLVPGGEGIALVNEAVTAPPGHKNTILVTRAGYDGPIVIRGQISRGSGSLWRSVPVADPARYSALVLRETLERRGIRVTGGVRAILDAEDSPVTNRTIYAPAFEKEPTLRVLAIHQSPPLQEILTVVNKKSHNLFADAVLRTVGRAVTGEGTIEAGSRAVHYLVECETGTADPDLEIFDGSGLSLLNRTTARTTIRLLSYMADSPTWESFWSTLPEAGDSQGLRRMYRTRAEGNLRAKTGTIDRVSALSGYVRAADGERLAFSIMSNNVPSTWRAKRIEDAIGARLAAFSRPGAARQSASQQAGTGSTGSSSAEGGSGAGADQRSEGVLTSDPAPRTPTRYRIEPGDNLETIARRRGTTVSEIRRLNPGVEPRRLIPGQEIILP